MEILTSIFALTIVMSSVRTTPLTYNFEDEEHAEITVPRSPKIQGPQIEYLLVPPLGFTIQNLTCEVEGIPMPKVVWLKDGVGVQQLSKPFETDFYAEDGLSVLQFPALGDNSQEYVANYTCVAANFLGRASKSYIIMAMVEADTNNSTITIPPGMTTQEMTLVV